MPGNHNELSGDIHMWAFFSALQAALDLLRECPKCGHHQRVHMRDKAKSVKCDRCKAKLPPNKYKL